MQIFGARNKNRHHFQIGNTNVDIVDTFLKRNS